MTQKVLIFGKNGRKSSKNLEDKRKKLIFASRTMDASSLLGLGCPRSEELSGSWRLFFVMVGEDRS